MTPSELKKYVSDGFDIAKAGKANEVYANVRNYLDQGLLEQRSHYAFGWIIYYALHQAPNNEIQERKKMLARYLNLQTPKPHKLHSMILTEAIRLYKDATDNAFIARKNGKTDSIPSFSILRFVDLWNLNHLREGDWRRKEIEGRRQSSTTERLITSCVNEMEDKKLTPADNFIILIEKAISLFPDSSTLQAQRATLHELKGEKREALQSLKKATLLTPSKFHLWSRLAEMTMKQENPKLHIALLSRATSLPGQEEFKGKIHLSLAEAWLSRNVFPQAAFELQIARSIYEKNGWKISPRFLEAEKLIPSGTTPQDPTPFYRQIAPLADSFVTEAISETEVKKNYHKNAAEVTDKYGRKRLQPSAWRVADAEGNNYWFTPSKFKIDENLGINTKVMVKLLNGKIVHARLP